MPHFEDYIETRKLTHAAAMYGKRPPFDYAIIDGFFKPRVAAGLAAEFPDFDGKAWHVYDNAIEVKKTCNDWNAFPRLTYRVFAALNSGAFLRLLEGALSPQTRLYPDVGLNGGGWHIHKRGGKLNTHLDYSIHPKLGLQRKLNLIVYLNPDWRAEWGGALGFWGNENAHAPGELVADIACEYNRAVIFDTTQNSWHGPPRPIECPERQYRKSLAVYYLCDPPADARGKALFAPTAEQQGDEQVRDLIEKRADIGTAASTYRERGAIQAHRPAR